MPRPSDADLLNRMDTALESWASATSDHDDAKERRYGLGLYRRMRAIVYHGADPNPGPPPRPEDTPVPPDRRPDDPEVLAGALEKSVAAGLYTPEAGIAEPARHHANGKG